MVVVLLLAAEGKILIMSSKAVLFPRNIIWTIIMIWFSITLIIVVVVSKTLQHLSLLLLWWGTVGRRRNTTRSVGYTAKREVFVNTNTYNIDEHSKSPPLLVCCKCNLDNLNCSCISPPHFNIHNEKGVGRSAERNPNNEAFGLPKCRSAGVKYMKA